MSIKKYFEMQRKFERMYNFHNNSGIQSAMTIANQMSRFYDSPIISQATLMSNRYSTIAQMAEPIVRQIQAQYRVLETFNIPSSIQTQHFYDYGKAQMYFQDIIGNLDWQAMGHDKKDYEQYQDFLGDLISEDSSISQEVEAETSTTPKKEINYITLLTVASHLINICTFIGKAINYITNPETQEKAIALYVALKEYVENILDHFPLD